MKVWRVYNGETAACEVHRIVVADDEESAIAAVRQVEGKRPLRAEEAVMREPTNGLIVAWVESEAYEG